MKKLVKVYAEWCGPCKVLDTRLKKLNLGDQLVSLNVESEEYKESGFSTKALPTVFVVDENNEVIEKITGVQDKQVYLDALSK